LFSSRAEIRHRAMGECLAVWLEVHSLTAEHNRRVKRSLEILRRLLTVAMV
jgi:hypothetical protein